jgi:hypothetical protein
VDEHPLARAEPGKLSQPVPGGRERRGYGRTGLEFHGIGQLQDVCRRDRDERGERAWLHRGDPVTGAQPDHVRPDGADVTGTVHAERHRHPVDGLVQAHRVEHVGVVQAGRVHPDLDFLRPRNPPRPADQLQAAQVTRMAHVQGDAVPREVDQGGLAFVVAKRGVAQVGDVTPAAAPTDLVVGPAGQQFGH